MPLALGVISLSQTSYGAAIFAPTDPILGGQEASGFFQIGAVGGGGNTWPDGESPLHAIDGVSQKYLNFARTFTGFLVDPGFNGGNGSIVSSMQLWTANDATARDPASYEVWGTNVDLDFSSTSFDMTQFTLISAGSIALPTGRNGTGTTALNNANSQTVTFANNADYKQYLIVFPTVRDANGANSMQIGEVQLFGVAAFTKLTWVGNVSGIWDVETTANWSVGGSPSTYSNGNAVTFDDTATPTSTNITVQAGGGTGVSPGSVSFKNDTLNYTIGGNPINSTGAMTVDGKGSVTLNNANTFAGGVALNAGSLIIGATGSLTSPTLSVNNVGSVEGSVVEFKTNSPLTIGALSGIIVTPANGTNSALITLGGNLTINQSANGTFPGLISGTGNLIKNGTATLTLTGVNDYIGSTIVNEGVLQSNAPGDNEQGALPAGKPVVVNGSGVLFFGTDDGLGYYGGSVSSLTVNGGRVVGGPLTHSTLPSVTLTAGTITAVDAGNFSSGPGLVLNYILDGNVTTAAAANPSSIAANSIFLRGDPTQSGTNSPITFNVARGTGPVDLVISSVINDAGTGLIKTGPGILALTSRNAYTGPTALNAGKIIISSSKSLGDGAVTIQSGGVLSFSADTIQGFTAFTLNNGAAISPDANILTLTDNNGNETRTAFVTDKVSLARGFTTSFVYTAGGNRQADGATFTIHNSPAGANAIGGGGGQLAYVGISNSASVQFNLYTGQNPPQPTGTAYAVGTSGVYTSTAPVDIASGNPIQVTLTYNPTAFSLTETLVDQVTQATYTQTFPNVDLAVVTGGSSAFIGFTGATGGAAASQTISNFALSNYSLAIQLQNEIAVPNNASVTLEVLPVSRGGSGAATLLGAVTLGSNSTFNVTAGDTVTNESYALTVSGATELGGNVTINVANNGTAQGLTILDAISQVTGATSLTKTGTGTLAINGGATYNGATNVNAGTLRVNGSLSGATNVNNGATLTGVGTTLGVTVANGGTLAPGDNGIGTLNTGPVTLQSGSTLSIEIGTLLSDSVSLGTNLTLSGTVNFTIALTADPQDDALFTIVDGTTLIAGYAGGARLSYLGNALDEGELFTVNSGSFAQDFTISYTADGGRDITLFAVPEPGSVSLLLAATTMLGFRRRRTS